MMDWDAIDAILSTLDLLAPIVRHKARASTSRRRMSGFSGRRAAQVGRSIGTFAPKTSGLAKRPRENIDDEDLIGSKRAEGERRERCKLELADTNSVIGCRILTLMEKVVPEVYYDWSISNLAHPLKANLQFLPVTQYCAGGYMGPSHVDKTDRNVTYSHKAFNEEYETYPLANSMFFPAFNLVLKTPGGSVHGWRSRDLYHATLLAPPYYGRSREHGLKEVSNGNVEDEIYRLEGWNTKSLEKLTAVAEARTTKYTQSRWARMRDTA
ncbi:hypothetical protein BT69DRAFT_1342371 [Atractiella rhizophila]|nr:hypothetical protein BT69DRAFT_1342371 [Atractiella rhizophila]